MVGRADGSSCWTDIWLCLSVCLREVDKMLQSVNSFLSPPVEDRRTSCCSSSPPPGDDDIIIVSRRDDDAMLKGPGAGPGASLISSAMREFPLKVRCRADLLKIAVQSVRDHLSPAGPGLTTLIKANQP